MTFAEVDHVGVWPSNTIEKKETLVGFHELIILAYCKFEKRLLSLNWFLLVQLILPFLRSLIPFFLSMTSFVICLKNVPNRVVFDVKSFGYLLETHSMHFPHVDHVDSLLMGYLFVLSQYFFISHGLLIYDGRTICLSLDNCACCRVQILLDLVHIALIAITERIILLEMIRWALNFVCLFLILVPKFQN